MAIIQNIKKTINYSRKNGYKEAFLAALERVTAKYGADYKYVEMSEVLLEAQKADKDISNILFSIIVPAYETQKSYMKSLIDSCIGQTYSKWELIIADGSTTDSVEQVVKRYHDTRIRYIKLDNNGEIADNTNRAIEYASGDYCGLLDHDDLLTPDALYCVAKAIGKKRPILVYTDEDKCDESGKRFYDPHIKYEFNLDLLLTNNYICHFLVVETAALKHFQIRKEYEGSQDYDLVLRIVSSLLLREREGQLKKGEPRMEERILHVQGVHYHWRCHPNSTAENPQSKMYAYEAGKKALIDFTARMGWKSEVRHDKHLGFYRIEYRNQVLTHRPDLAAVGGYIVKRGKITSGIYQGQPLFYAGYMNRMDLYQNVMELDIRNLAVNKPYQQIYESVTGHPYESTLATLDRSSDMARNHMPPLPQWIRELERSRGGVDKIKRINSELGRRLIQAGGRLLLDPKCVRKI